MRDKTIKNKIFIFNTLMVVVLLVVFLLVNIVVVKIYLESVENEFVASMGQIIDEATIKNLIKDWTVHRNEFILIFGIDGIICIGILVFVSRIFTKRLSLYITEPLEKLENAVKRIENNNLSENIEYSGSAEFERVCNTFNNMQEHIINEQEKNKKYEKARTDMIAGISHDLRTPLTAVKGSLKGVIDGIATTKKQQDTFLQIAYKRTEEIEVLLNQLFYFSKLESGNMKLTLKQIEINIFLKNYVSEKQEILGNDSIFITYNSLEKDIYCNIDCIQIVRVFDNILENSIKYSEKTPVKVDIDLKMTDKNDMIQISFCDNGVGVSSEKLPYIFDEFYRADSSRNKKDGNGLGLYIVKYLVEQMGGNVMAESENGFKITIELPYNN